MDHLPALVTARSIIAIFPHLTKLDIKLRSFPPNFELGLLLTTSLEELYIRHEVTADLPHIAHDIVLPNLQTLGITYSTWDLFNKVQARSLRKLIYYPWKEMGNPGEGANAENTYRRLTHIDFEDWSGIEHMREGFGPVSTLSILMGKLSALRSVKFVDSYVGGNGFVNLMKDRSGRVDTLEMLTLSQVSGITREECERLAAFVKKLNVYL